MPAATTGEAVAARGWRSRGRLLVAGFSALLLVSLAVAPVVAMPRWRLGRWQAETSFLLDWEQQNDKRAQNDYETILFQERLYVRNVGAYLFDPRLLTLNLGGGFGLSQEDGLAVQDTPLRVGNGILYDYAFDAFLLNDSPYPISLFANRNENTLAQGFGGRSDVTFESRGGIFELREGNLFEKYGVHNLSASLDVHQELRNEDSLVFGSPYRRDETRNIVRYATHKGGEQSDFDLRYEFNDVNDAVNSQNVFDSHTLRALHSVDFGPTLNRRLDSLLYYFGRRGAGSGNFVSLNEVLRLDHYENLASEYRYDFSRSDTDVGATTTNSASVGLRHRLYERLTTTVDAHGTYQNFPNGERSFYGGRGGLAYRRSLPWQGELLAHLHGGYRVDDNNFTSSRIDVVDEAHTAPPVIGGGNGFALDSPFVFLDTVVVFDVEGGARLPTEVNVDYILEQVGSVTRVIPLAGSPVIRPGDALEVSYSYAVDPSLTFSTATLNVGVGAEFAWIGLSYEHDLSNQSRLSGTASENFLIDQNLDRFAVDLHHRWDALRGQTTLSYEILNSTIVDSRTWRFSQLLAYQPRSNVDAQLSGDQYWATFPGENRDTQSYLVRASVDWLTPFGATVSPFAGFSAFRDTGTENEDIVDAGIRMRWIYHSLEIAPSFTWADYRRRLNELRAQLQITRRFF
jgi:hypothetical protein